MPTSRLNAGVKRTKSSLEEENAILCQHQRTTARRKIVTEEQVVTSDVECSTSSTTASVDTTLDEAEIVPAPKRPDLLQVQRGLSVCGRNNNDTTTPASIGDKESSLTPSSSSTFRPPLESLPPKILQEILLLAGNSPRELFRVVTNIKAFYGALQPRPDIVISAAVFHDRRSKSHMETIVDCVRKQQIHIPSTMRLLRLVNMQYCERGDQCCGYNLETRMPARLGFRLERKPCSLQLVRVCCDCLEIMNCSFAVYTAQFPGVEAYLPASTSCWMTVPRDFFIEHATGEKVGGLLLGKHLLQLRKTYLWESHNWCSFDSDFDHELPGETAFIYALYSLHKTLARPKTLAAAAQRVVICKSFDESNRMENCRRQRELEMWRENAIKGAERRKVKAKAITNDVRQALGEVAISYPFLFDCCFDETGTGEFEVGFIDEIIGPAIRRPSKQVTKAQLGQMIEAVVDIVITFEEAMFLGKKRLEFLDRTNRFQERILTFLRNTTQKTLLPLWEHRSQHEDLGTFADAVVQGRPLDALAIIFCDEWYHYRPSRRYSYRNSIPQPKLDFEEFFCINVVDRAHLDPPDTVRIECYRNLATAICNQYFFETNDQFFIGAYAKIKHRYSFMELKFLHYVELIQSYYNGPRTKDFLAEAKPNGKFTANKAVSSIFKLNMTEKRMLDGQQFAELLRLHQDMLRRGY